MSAAAPPAAALTAFMGWTTVLVLVVGGLLYLPTFRCSYGYDDMDHLNHVAKILAGEMGYWSAVFHPHLEHQLPLVRMAFHASAALFGVWALPFRLVIFLAHAAAGFFMALVARRYTGSNVAGWAAALAYILPAGFSSMWVWMMNGSGVTLALLGVTGALAALAWSERLGRTRARWLAAAGLLFAAAAESTLVPLFVAAALFDEVERRRGRQAHPRRPVGAFSAVVAAGAAASMAASSFMYRQVAHHGFALDFKRGLPRALFLVLSAPFRYGFPGLALTKPGEHPVLVPIHGVLLGFVVAAVAAAAVVGLGHRFPAALVPAILAAASGSLCEVLLIGLGRAATTYSEIYDADRYYFTLLLPICLLVAGIVAGVAAAAGRWSPLRRRAVAALAIAALAAEAALHYQALQALVPFATFAAHEQRFAQLAKLDAALARAARRVPPGEPPLRFPAANVFFPDVHNGRISAALLLLVIGRGRTGVELADGPVGERDARWLNPAFEEWAKAIGEPLPYLSISGGNLVNAHLHSRVDFRREAGDATVVAGFLPWEGTFRWMEEKGVLQLFAEAPGIVLRMGGPAEELARRFPGRPPLSVRVSITDQVTGETVPAGTVTIGPGDEDAIQRLDACDFFHKFGGGRSVLLVLEAGPGWRPAELFAGNSVVRQYTVRVSTAGFIGARCPK